MQAGTQRLVDAAWAELLGVDDQLWQGVTVHAHAASLHGYAGWYVAWRGAGLHVSAPATATAEEIGSLRDEPLSRLTTGEFWAGFAAQRRLVLRGPAMHSYLDDDPGPTPGGVSGVVDLVAADLDPIRAEVTAQEWDDWHTDDPVHPVGIVEAGRVVAAASLGPWNGVVRDIGVVVVPDRRGRGLAAQVGRSCASYAIREQAYAIWRAALANVASVRTAERLGFEPYCTQLAVRPGAPLAAG